MIIGCGTGRCGTMSLAALLNAQPGLSVSHELGFGPVKRKPLPWEPDWTRWRDAMTWLGKKQAAGDVAHFWLPYLPKMLTTMPDLRVICLRRDVDETVNSFLINSGAKNQISAVLDHGELRTGRSICFPKYHLPKAEAIRAYWEEYYERAGVLSRLHPTRFRVVDTESLNATTGQSAILDFVGVRDHVYREGIRLNASGERAVA